MESKRTFLLCEHCKNLVGLVFDGGGVLVCCGEPMRFLRAGEVDASAEKHVPAWEREGDRLTISVGSAPHPMTPEHHIAWIAVCQDGTTQRKELAAGGPAGASFTVEPGECTVYAYCNLHGLWESRA